MNRLQLYHVLAFILLPLAWFSCGKDNISERDMPMYMAKRLRDGGPWRIALLKVERKAHPDSAHTEYIENFRDPGHISILTRRLYQGGAGLPPLTARLHYADGSTRSLGIRTAAGFKPNEAAITLESKLFFHCQTKDLSGDTLRLDPLEVNDREWVYVDYDYWPHNKVSGAGYYRTHWVLVSEAK